MQTILVIGASGFVGRRLATALLGAGHAVRCLARDPAKVADLAAAGCAVVPGDFGDPAALRRAMDGAEAIYVSMHTLSPQRGAAAGGRFMDAETTGVRTIVTGGRALGVRRVVYVTSLGITADAASEWLRERWRTEQSLLQSDLDATVVRPGNIVGVGGRGFDTIVGQARRRVAVTLVDGGLRMRTIAVDDLVYYLVGLLDEPRARSQRYDVGSDDVPTANAMIDTVADVLGTRHPVKLRFPAVGLRALAPVVERLGKLSRGAVRGLVDGLDTDMIGDPMPIRALLPRPLLSFRQSVERALAIA